MHCKSSPRRESSHVSITTHVAYLRIALFAELLNLARRDVAVIVAVSALKEGQASADAAFSGSWMVNPKKIL